MLLEQGKDYARIGRYLSAGHVDGALMFSLHGDDPCPPMAAATGLPDRLRRPARLAGRRG